MVRGVIHLILYRIVYYHLTLAPSEVTGPAQLMQYLVANFMLYLRVSGLFHLIVGMLLSLGIVVRTARRDLDAEHTLPVQVVSLYWHFVDAVWIAIFVTLYLTVVLS